MIKYMVISLHYKVHNYYEHTKILWNIIINKRKGKGVENI